MKSVLMHKAVFFHNNMFLKKCTCIILQKFRPKLVLPVRKVHDCSFLFKMQNILSLNIQCCRYKICICVTIYSIKANPPTVQYCSMRKNHKLNHLLYAYTVPLKILLYSVYCVHALDFLTYGQHYFFMWNTNLWQILSAIFA